MFSIAGSIGRVALVNKDILPANTNQALAIIRGYNFEKYFFLYFLNSNYVKKYIKNNPTMGAQPNLSLKQINNMCIYFPNSLHEQKKIGTFLKHMSNLNTLYDRKLFLNKVYTYILDISYIFIFILLYKLIIFL